jgi:hypothetical protein
MSILIPVVLLTPVWVPALVLLLAWPVRRRYTSTERWRKIAPLDKIAALRAEVIRQSTVPVIIVRDKRGEVRGP